MKWIFILCTFLLVTINLCATRYEAYSTHIQCVIVYDNVLRKFGYFLVYEDDINDAEFIINNYKPLSLEMVNDYLFENLPPYIYFD